jgi:hypothetical protein
MLSKQLASMLFSISLTLKIDAVSGLLSDCTASLPRRQLFIVTVESTLSMSLSIYLWLYSPCEPWPLFRLLNLYTVRRTSWTEDQPVARPIPAHKTTQIQNKRTQVKVKVKVTLRLTVSQSVCLGVEPRLGLMTRYLRLF